MSKPFTFGGCGSVEENVALPESMNAFLTSLPTPDMNAWRSLYYHPKELIMEIAKNWSAIQQIYSFSSSGATKQAEFFKDLTTGYSVRYDCEGYGLTRVRNATEYCLIALVSDQEYRDTPFVKNIRAIRKALKLDSVHTAAQMLKDGKSCAETFEWLAKRRAQIAKETHQRDSDQYSTLRSGGRSTRMKIDVYRDRIMKLIPKGSVATVPVLMEMAYSGYHFADYLNGIHKDFELAGQHDVHLMTYLVAFQHCPKAEFEGLFGYKNAPFPSVIVCHESRYNTITQLRTKCFETMDEFMKQSNLDTLARVFWWLSYSLLLDAGWEGTVKRMCLALCEAKGLVIPHNFTKKDTLFYEAYCTPVVDEFVEAFPGLINSE